MKRLTLLAILGLTLCVPRSGFAQEETIAKTSLKPGEMAPDFTLLSDQWKPVKLSDYRGKKSVVLAFYVLAFTGG